MVVKGLVASIIQFLTQQLEEGDITEDSRESLEVAIQCLESAYNVQASDASPNFNLQNAYRDATKATEPDAPKREATAEEKAEAERLKTEGNNFMKENKLAEALQSYTKAIELDSGKAVYYCNRAAVHSKMDNHQLAIKDSVTALAIDPMYSKAFARLGLAYSSLNRHKEAKECYEKASEMEPDNECYRNNIQLAEEKLSQQGTNNVDLRNLDFNPIVGHPAFVNMARQLFTDPAMQNMMSFINTGRDGQGGSIDALIEAGGRLVNEIRATDPELIENLRSQLRDGSDPESSQNN